jgi:integrase
MPKRPDGLQRRGSVWWLRVRVPKDLQESIGKTEVRRSLRTSDYQEAVERVRTERYKVAAEFKEAKRRLAQDAPTEISEQDLWYAASKLFIELEKEGQRQNLTDFPMEEALLELGWLSDPEQYATGIYEHTTRALKLAGLPEPQRPSDRVALQRYVHRAIIESEQRIIARASPIYRYSRDALFDQLNSQTALPPQVRLSLETLIERYEADATRAPGSPKSRLKRDSEYRLIRHFFGARTRLADINREQCRAFVSLLTRYPANATKRFGDLPPDKVIALAGEKELAPMSATTANAYLATFGRLMQFALQEGWLSENPTNGLKIQAKRSAPKNGRDPFSTKELNKIFQAPLFTGCKDDRQGYAQPGSQRPRRGRFWVPLLSLFTGMRLNEACQLTCDDIVEMDNVAVILIRGTDDETKRVKTAAGYRFVPIHPQLHQLSFLDHVEGRRNADGSTSRLFPELTMAASGYYSDNFSKWFSRFLGKCGIEDDRKAFHSFRHTYRDALREADISIERVRALGGWSTGNTEDRYGAGHRASTLACDIARVTFPGLETDHLK